MKSRTKARELALQYLYQVDLTESYNPDMLDSFCVTFSKESDDETIGYARKVIEGIYSNLQNIDSAIDFSSKNWTVRRMSYVDRNILRISTYELMFRIDIPVAVIINEGIELAKKFGSPKLPSFANGVLDKISQKNVR